MNAPRLSRLSKISYGSGDIGLSLTSTCIGVFFNIFLVNVAGLNPVAAGTAILVARFWDWVNDPIIGYLSDRTRSRWGRRRPYILFGAIPFGLTFALMWMKPPLTPLLLSIYYGGAYVLFDTAASFVYMPYYALTPELTNDYDQRTSLTAYRMFFSIIASMLAFSLPDLIVGEWKPEAASRALLVGCLFGLVSALPLFGVFFGTREKKEYSEVEPPRILATLKAALKNKPLALSLGIYLFTWVTMDLMQANLYFFILYGVRQEKRWQLLFASIFVTAICCLPLWNWAARRLGKRLAYIIGVSFWAAAQLVLITMGAQSSIVLITALCIVAGIGVGAAHVLPWSMLPDAVEWDEWKTGERHEGSFYSMVTVCQKIASMIAIPGSLFLLGIFGYQSGGVEVQPHSAVFAIRILAGPVPAVLLGLGILCAALYPISRSQHAKILAELEARRAGKPSSR
jgi:GPH family glycoside/pentoside/hexuronide:cation symporter